MSQSKSTSDDRAEKSHGKDSSSIEVGTDGALEGSCDTEGLQRGIDSIPGAVWLVMLLAMAERFSFYGMTAPFMNYMQNSRNDKLHGGALGWGQSRASQVSNIFYILTLLTPIGASLAADKHLGRFKVLCITFAIYLVGSILLVISSLGISAGFAAPLFIVSLVFIAVGMSGVNGLLAAFVGDQYTTEDGVVATRRDGKRIIVDRGRTIESIYNIYYWCINVGGLAGLATTELELHVGFWVAFLLPTCALAISAAILYIGHKRLHIVPAQQSALPQALKVMWLAVRGGFSLDSARPTLHGTHDHRSIPWTDEFVDEMGTALKACRMMILGWPVLWLCRGQISNNLVSQAAQMETSGVPNDMMFNANPVIIILILPLVDRVILPRLRHLGFTLTAATRLVIGFTFEALSMAMAAAVQKLIYNSGPCYGHPLRCTTSGGVITPNNVSVFLQLPVYALEAFSEILSSPAGYELAFTMAPVSMKSLIQAVFSATGALGATLSIIISPTYKDPHMVWVYTSLATAMGIVTIVFYCIYGKGSKQA
jgi:POT family proton-dependent oligopeptide transporter